MLLREWLTAELSQYGSRRIVVWYDAGGTLFSLAGQGLAPDRRLLTYDGSYLALRLRLEGDDPGFANKWLVYVPEQAPEPSWLRDWELFGARVDLDLLDLLRLRAQLPVDQELRTLLRGRGCELARQLASRWETLLGAGPVSKGSLVRACLAVAFEQAHFDFREAAIMFLAEEQAVARLTSLNLDDQWRRTVEEELGLDGLPRDSTALRHRLAATVLLTELVQTSGQLGTVVGTLLPPPGKQPLAADLARTWRQTSTWQNVYQAVAERVQREYRLAERLNVDEALLATETFPIVDQLLLREAEQLAGPGGFRFGENRAALRRLADKRRNLFWARNGRAPFWELLSIATSLQEHCEEAARHVGDIRQLDQLITSYAAAQGWWRLDSAVLKMASLAVNLSGPQREQFVAPAIRTYREWLDLLTRKMGQLVEEEGWAPDPTPLHASTGARGQPTAFFLVDALRMDLGWHLKERIEQAREFTVDLRPRRAPLPTITEVGMASVLPVSASVSVQVEAGKLRVLLGDQAVTSSQDRKKYLEQALGRSTRVVSLTEAEHLSEIPAGARLVTVLWDGVDRFGAPSGHLSPDTFFSLVDRVYRAILRMRDLGCTRIVVTADHGFLFLPAGAEQFSRTAPPGGENAVTGHRFIIGEFSRAEGTHEFNGAQVGSPGVHRIAVPAGLAVFALPGETPTFTHGGLSPQEAIVPLLIVEPTDARRVRVRMEVPDVVRSATVRIRLVPEPQSLVDSPRRVRAEVWTDDTQAAYEVADVAPNVPEVLITVTWSRSLISEGQTPWLTFRLVDADTGDLLEEQRVPCQLLF